MSDTFISESLRAGMGEIKMIPRPQPKAEAI